MSIVHAKSVTVADFTGTVTALNSQGSTTTVAASDLARPSDWNSGHNQLYTLSGNTAGNSTVSGTNVILQGGNNITLSGTGSTIVIEGGAGGGGGTATMWQPFNEGVNVMGQQGQGTLHIVPLPTPVPAALGELEVDRLCVPIYYSNASNSTGSVTISLWHGLYLRDQNTQLTLAHSTSYSTGITFSGTDSASLHHGIRLHTIPWTTTVQDGRYYVGHIMRTTSGGANATVSQALVSQLNSNFSGIFGAASTATAQWPLGYGVYNSSTTALPGTIAFSRINGTASLAARPPSWFMISSTA